MNPSRPASLWLQRPTAKRLRQHHFQLLGGELNVKPFILPLEDMKSYLLFGLEENRNHLYFWGVSDHWLWVRSIFIRDCVECSGEKHISFILVLDFQRRGNYKKERLAERLGNTRPALHSFTDSLRIHRTTVQTPNYSCAKYEHRKVKTSPQH